MTNHHPSANLYGTLTWEEAAEWWRTRALELAAELSDCGRAPRTPRWLRLVERLWYR